MATDRRASRFDRRKSTRDGNQERRSTDTPEVHILLETRAPNLVVTLIGPITASNGLSVRDAVLKAKTPDSIKRVVVNVSKVGFIDSAGISFFLDIRKQLEKDQKSLVLINPSPFFKKVLDILNLKDIFNVREIEFVGKDKKK